MVHPMDLEGPESADLLADELDNPFYCPRLPAAVYIDSLRHRIQRPSDAAVNEEDDALIRSFGRLLDQAMFESDLHIHDSHSFAEHGTGSFLAESKSAFSSIPAWEAPNSGTFVALNRPGRTPAFPTNLRAFRDRASSSSPSDESDTDMIDYLCGPVKRLRSSSDTQHYSPVDLNSGAIHLFADEMHSMSSPSDPDAVLHGWPYEQPLKAASTPDKTFVEEPALGKDLKKLVDDDPENELHSLLYELDALLPNLRLARSFSTLDSFTLRDLVDAIAHSGNLTKKVLRALRPTKVASLSLTETVLDPCGINIAGRDVFKVFAKFGGFTHLREIRLSDAPICDSDLTYLHHLPRLALLALDNTTIGNEGVFLLVPLKQTLTELTISTNPRIDDDAVPALLILNKLMFLSIIDTSITIVGLRRIAAVINSEKRVVDIEIPLECEAYIDQMHKKYSLSLPSPLIASPSACGGLTAAALKRNLREHAQSNPSISTTGSRPELAVRLEGILRERKKDLAVRELLWMDEAEEGGDEEMG